ncbi:MAG: hypothetical protein JXB48_20255 [Candidatus Latescibacteria bacterium]|nr:hypothetical protein [Candidatus Latescibacterota bacterium]
MKRRNMVKLLPLSVFGLTALPATVGAFGVKPLGLRYLDRVNTLLKKIKASESEEMIEASHRMAQTIRNGSKVYIVWDSGHSNDYDLWPDRPGRPDFFEQRIPEDTKKGDLILTNNYEDNLKAMHDRGVFIVSGPRPWGADCEGSELIADRMKHMKIRPFADIWINLYATSYGAIMDVPGSPNPTGPVSGVVGMMTFWMMISDVARLLAADGLTFGVYGDEPNVNSKVTVNINEPLGDDYFDAAIGQQEAIAAEFKTINDIAAMAVHSALQGGRVYVYSRHTANLCAEGTVRRGGLALTLGISGPPDKLRLMEDPLRQGDRDPIFKPTDRDMVIMGIGKPDDPDDLAALDIFKKAGMGIAVIGPAIRNNVVPNGRTVPKEADLYAGHMMDTYGLFALPGIKKKIAPTSGLINNQIFWAVCCQIAEQIVERTGIAPVIFLSGALKGGLERLDSDKEIYIKRGY